MIILHLIDSLYVQAPQCLTTVDVYSVKPCDLLQRLASAEGLRLGNLGSPTILTIPMNSNPTPSQHTAPSNQGIKPSSASTVTHNQVDLYLFAPDADLIGGGVDL